jgi:hypothetical protein
MDPESQTDSSMTPRWIIISKGSLPVVKVVTIKNLQSESESNEDHPDPNPSPMGGPPIRSEIRLGSNSDRIGPGFSDPSQITSSNP